MANLFTSTRTSEKSAAKQSKEQKSSQASYASGRQQVTDEKELHEMIATAAYYRAERSGFNCNDTENWLEAEKEIRERFFH